MGDRVPLAALTRAGVETLVRGYAQSVALKVSFYRGRPANIQPPHAFIDRMSEVVVTVGPENIQRTITVELVIVWGILDTADAVDQRDRFVDGFAAWVTTHYEDVYENATVTVTSIRDEPIFRHELLSDEGKPWYGCLISLEVYAET